MTDMVLVDTSVWIDHLRYDNHILRSLLEKGEVLCHPFIIGEMACGTLQNRTIILSLLGSLDQAVMIGNDEILDFIEINHLMSKGIGLVDMHLLGSAMKTGCRLWTMDKRLNGICRDFNIDTGRLT